MKMTTPFCYRDQAEMLQMLNPPKKQLKDAILGHTYLVKGIPYEDTPTETVVVAVVARENIQPHLLILGWKDPTAPFGWGNDNEVNTNGYSLTKVSDFGDYCTFLWADPLRECVPVEISCSNTCCNGMVNITANSCALCGQDQMKPSFL
jgi:hypothetical protein